MSHSDTTSPAFTEWLCHMLSVYRELDDADKNRTLNALISASGPSQLYLLSNRLPEFVFRDFISHLPTELVISILQYLDGQELLICCQVCKSWSDIINSLAGLWWQHARDAGANVSAGEDNLQQPELVDPASKKQKVGREHIFKQLYLKALTTLRGFNTGTTVNIQEEFIDKGSWRITFVRYFGGHIVTGCDDHTVQVWDIQTGRALITVTTHSVCCLTITGTHLYTASFNANADSWDLSTRRHCKTFCGHTSAVLSIDVTPDEDFILTGSVDKTAKLWDQRNTPANLVKTLSDVHEDWVFEVKFLPSKAGHLLFLTCDSTLWNLWLMKDTGDVVMSCRTKSDWPSKFTSFYHVPEDPFQTFTCQWEEKQKTSWLTKYHIQQDSCVVEKQLHFQIPLDTVKAYLLGAGQKFAVIMCSISRKDFHVIDILRNVVVATIVTPDFCMLTRNGSTVTLCETSWLNGFNFFNMKPGTPVFAASVGRNTVILGTWADTAKTGESSNSGTGSYNTTFSSALLNELPGRSKMSGNLTTALSISNPYSSLQDKTESLYLSTASKN